MEYSNFSVSVPVQVIGTPIDALGHATNHAELKNVIGVAININPMKHDSVMC